MGPKFEVTGQEAVDRLVDAVEHPTMGAELQEAYSPAVGYVRFVFWDGGVVTVKVAENVRLI